MTRLYKFGWLLLMGMIASHGHIVSSEEISDTANEDKDELVFAQVIFRHGNRTITSTYPNDPYNNDSFWPEGYQSLTNVGRRLQFELGKYMRRRYQQLLANGDPTKKVYIRSTDLDRTLMSAQCNAAALFPPVGTQVWKSSMRWQPMPIHTIPINNDYLLYQSISCPKLDKLRDEYMESDDMKALFKRYNALIQFISENSGMEIRTVNDLTGIHQALSIEHQRGLPLSNWAEKALLQSNGAMEYFAAVYFESFTHTAEMKKAKTGFLIKELFDHFKQKSLSQLQPDRVLWIYSAHDNTIINVLNALNVYHFHVPPFSASIHFELYRRASEYYVQLFYRKDKFQDVPPIEIPHCGTKCPLDKLYELYNDILPSEDDTYESLCRL